MSVLLQSVLEDSARRVPDKIALVTGDGQWSYAALDAAANRLAHSLRRCGVRRGDRVVLVLRNTWQMVVSIFATLKADAVCVPLNPGLPAAKRAAMLANCTAAAVLVEAETFASGTLVPEASIAAAPVIIVVGSHGVDGQYGPGPSFAAAIAESSSERPATANIDLDLACLIYTSGSTGEPLGVMSDHSNVLFAVTSIVSYLELRDDDVVLNLMPLSFDYGLYQIFITFQIGGRLVLENGFGYVPVLQERIQREGVTGLPGVPTLWALLLRGGCGSNEPSSVRFVTNTAAPLPSRHATELQRRFHRARVYCMYGLTETKRTLYLPPEQLLQRPGSVGIPIPGTEAWIEDEQGNRVAPGIVGELVVRGRHVMRGYWNAPVATARRFGPGEMPGERVCRTGDLFYTDDEGYFYFVARQDDVIKTRGEKVAPAEVERVLIEMTDIAEAAVVGVPDAILGRAVAAYLVPKRARVTRRDVLEHCRRHLEDFMIPKHIEFVDELPRSANGKVHKAALVK